MFEEYQEKSFYHALRTKGFVILAGLSGTGKTKIVEEFVGSFKRQEINENIKIKLKAISDAINENINIDNWDMTTEGYQNAIVKKLMGEGSGNEWITNIIHTGFKDYALTKQVKTGSWMRRSCFGREQEISSDEDLTEYFNILKEQLLLLKKFAQELNFTCIKSLDCFSEKAQKLLAFVCNPDAWAHIFTPDEIEKIKDVIFQSNSTSTNGEIKFKFIPIRPDFKDSKSLLGYYNPLKEEYHSTELLNFILKAQDEYIEKQTDASPYLVLFDEMNLARVEYYFADFLSVLESKRVAKADINGLPGEMKKSLSALSNDGKISNSYDHLQGFTSKGIPLSYDNNKERYEINHKCDSQDFECQCGGYKKNNTYIPKELYLPPNLYFVGSVNIDETTHMFSPKVLDRAFTIEFDADIAKYIEHINPSNKIDAAILSLNDFTRLGKFATIDKDAIKKFVECNNTGNKYHEKLKEINEILKPYGMHFGYRVFDEIIMFMHNALNKDTNVKFSNGDDEAFDLAVKMKVLPKFHGTRQKLEKPIVELLKKICKVKYSGKNLESYNAGKLEFEKSKDQKKEEEKETIELKGMPILVISEKDQNSTTNNDENSESENHAASNNTKTFLKIDGIDDKELNAEYPHTAHKLFEMLYNLQTNGFASFI
jgi:5-methylcytosine-specific restriction endonuclease McrBC GTP-binding regulatory subunit McrB